MLKNCFVSFISPCIYQCDLRRIEEKEQNLIWTSINSISLYLLKLCEILEEFLLHHPIYTVRSSETEDMQILWKFFLSNLAIIKKRYYTETCSNLSQYCFVLKIYILFFKIQPIKSLRDLFLRNYYWENSWMVRQVLYLRLKGKLLLVLFTKHQWVLHHLFCYGD